MKVSASNLTPEPLSAAPVESVRRRPVPAWLLSCGLHTLLLVAMALLYQTTLRGTESETTRPGGIVLVAMDQETTEYLSEGDQTDALAPSDRRAQNPPPLPDTAERPPEQPGAGSQPLPIAGTGDDLLQNLPGANAFTEGVRPGQDLGGRVTTEIFGVQGTGSRFVYVFDKSDSMNGYEGRPLRAAKEALSKSLDALGDVQQFQIVFYNQETQVFTRQGAARLYFGNDDNKRAAKRFVQGVQAHGGTDHLQALKFALGLGPDVLFLLTDAEGGFTPDELRLVSDWNRAGAVINAIEFGVGAQNDADRSMETLVREHRGQYVYKNILTLEQ